MGRTYAGRGRSAVPQPRPVSPEIWSESVTRLRSPSVPGRAPQPTTKARAYPTMKTLGSGPGWPDRLTIGRSHSWIALSVACQRCLPSSQSVQNTPPSLIRASNGPSLMVITPAPRHFRHGLLTTWELSVLIMHPHFVHAATAETKILTKPTTCTVATISWRSYDFTIIFCRHALVLRRGSRIIG